MATKKVKCPARITMLKEASPQFIIHKSEHVHAELKRVHYGLNKVPHLDIKTLLNDREELKATTYYSN